MSIELPPRLVQARRLMESSQFVEAEARILGEAKTSPAYRAAACLGVMLIVMRGEPPSFRLEAFLAEFLASPPRSPAERACLQKLGAFYIGRGDNASASELRFLLSDDAADTLPLPDLPSLPSLPPEPVVAAPITADLNDLLVKPAPATESFAHGAAPRPLSELVRNSAMPTESGAVASSSPPAAQREPAVAPPVAPSRPKRRVYGVGAHVADRYVLKKKLGSGGMANVFAAVDEEIDDHVAMKIFHASLTENEAELARFKREVKIARRLHHQNIVRVFDLGHDGPRYFITMELLKGRDLSHLLKKRRRKPLSLRAAEQILHPLLDGLAHAHELGIVHRDIKPANLFITREGRQLKIMDFGIAKTETVEGGTMTGTMMGTPHYMSPEQVKDTAHVGPEADLYAVGVLAYELWAGRRPFEGTSPIAVAMAQVQEQALPLSDINPALPPALVTWVHNLLVKDPEKRPQSAAAARASLDKALQQ